MRKLLPVFLVVCMMQATGAAAQDERRISTSGTGMIEAVPDMAVIDIGVVKQASKANDALAASSAAVQVVLDTLEASGVDARDVQTSTISLHPIWSGRGPNNDEPPSITGYQSSNTLTIRLRNLDALGGVLDAVVSEGANTFNGLRFAIQNPEPFHAQARAAAVRDAMMRAEQFAAAAGVGIGQVITISQGGAGRAMPMMEMAAARMSDVPISAGELSISAQVTMVFAIAD